MKKSICMLLTLALLIGSLSFSETIAAKSMIVGASFITISEQATLKAAAKKPYLNYTKKTMKAGKSLTLKLTGATVKSWKSSDEEVATVTNKGKGKGKVTAKKAGRVIITCKAKGGKKYTCKITVKESDKPSNDKPSNEDPSSEEPSNEDPIYAKMIALKEEYPEGMKWTNDNYYAWKGGIYSGGYGCAGFAFMLSDAAFGSLPARKHTDFSKVRVGDILRINNDTHSVIVLEVKMDGVIVAEGNYNSSIHWGRGISFSSIKETGTYVLTRYED